MQARHTPRAPARLELVRARGSSLVGRPVRALDRTSARLERHPADGAIVGRGRGAATPSPPGSEREVAIAFRSILLPPGAEGRQAETADEPEFFRDLNLDKIVAAITAGKDDYDLRPSFIARSRDLATIEYRHEVMRDLEHDDILSMVRSFAQGMRSIHQHLALSAKLHYPHQKKLWFLDAVAHLLRHGHCACTGPPAPRICNPRAWWRWRRYLIDYMNSEGFTALVAETDQLRADLATVKYSMLIKGDKITVEKYEDTPDYSAVVERTFARFQQGAVKDYLVKFADRLDMNHVEAAVLGFVANLYPEIFSYLDNYVERNQGFIDPTIGRFDREIQFYVSYLEHIAVLKGHGLRFCYPKLSDFEQGGGEPRRLRPGARPSAHGREGGGGVQRFPPRGQRTDPGRVGAEPGRQDDVRAHLRPAALSREPGISGAGDRRPSSSCSTGCSPISSGRRTSRPCGASSRMTCSGSTRFWPRRPRTASSS